MKNGDQLLNKVTKDTKKYENMIKYRFLYNIRNIFVLTLLKDGIIFDYALPYVFSTVLMSYFLSSNGNSPFKIDEKIEKANVETIDTSNGVHVERISFDYKYYNKSLEYSTGWIKNDNGLYERTVTSYQVNDSINLEDVDSVLNKSKEELDNALTISGIKTIRKDSLDEDDYIYDEDALIVVNNELSDDYTINRPESSGEFAIRLFNLIWISVLLGVGLGKFKKIVLKTYFIDKLREAESSYMIIDNKKLEAMKELLEIKKQNLEFLSDLDNMDSNDYGYSYKFKRR